MKKVLGYLHLIIITVISDRYHGYILAHSKIESVGFPIVLQPENKLSISPGLPLYTWCIQMYFGVLILSQFLINRANTGKVVLLITDIFLQVHFLSNIDLAPINAIQLRMQTIRESSI